MTKTDPAMTPDSPWKPAGVYLVVNTERVLWLPAWNTRRMAMIRKTAISKTPRIVPNLAEVRTPKYPAAKMISRPRIAHGHHRFAG